MDYNYNFKDIFFETDENEERNISSASKINTLTIESRKDLCEDITLTNVPDTIEEIELQIDRLKTRWNEFTYLIGQRLKIVNDRRLFESKGYSDFASYTKVALKMSENNAYYYISIFEYFTEEQTKTAGSKLKLIIPVLNKIKKDKCYDEEAKNERLEDVKNVLYNKIKYQSYRDAEKTIKDMRKKYFYDCKYEEDIYKSTNKIEVRKDRIIVHEDDKDIQDLLVKVIENFYL